MAPPILSHFDPEVFPPNLSPLELMLALICAGAGARFVGIQRGIASRDDIVLFNTRFGATCAASLNGFGSVVVQERLQLTHEKFGIPIPPPIHTATARGATA